MSSRSDKLQFYEEYLDQLREWCDYCGIETTSESIGIERIVEEEITWLKYPST